MLDQAETAQHRPVQRRTLSEPRHSDALDVAMIAPHLPPGPPGRWLLGHLPEFRRDMLGFYRQLAQEYGDVVAFRLGPRSLVLVSHPDPTEQILVAENRNF